MGGPQFHSSSVPMKKEPGTRNQMLPRGHRNPMSTSRLKQTACESRPALHRFGGTSVSGTLWMHEIQFAPLVNHMGTPQSHPPFWGPVAVDAGSLHHMETMVETMTFVVVVFAGESNHSRVSERCEMDFHSMGPYFVRGSISTEHLSLQARGSTNMHGSFKIRPVRTCTSDRFTTG